MCRRKFRLPRTFCKQLSAPSRIISISVVYSQVKASQYRSLSLFSQHKRKKKKTRGETITKERAALATAQARCRPFHSADQPFPALPPRIMNTVSYTTGIDHKTRNKCTYPHTYICMYRTHPQFKARTLRVDMHIYTVRTRKTKKPVVGDITAARAYTLCHALCHLFCYDTQSALLYMLFSNSSHKSETRNRSRGYCNSRVAHKHTNTHTHAHTCHLDYTLHRNKTEGGYNAHTLLCSSLSPVHTSSAPSRVSPESATPLDITGKVAPTRPVNP